MAGSPAIRIATQAGGKTPEPAPAPERSGFPAALMAATSGAPRAQPARAEPQDGRESVDAGSDPAIAAALAALFPSAHPLTPPPGGAVAPDDTGSDALSFSGRAQTGGAQLSSAALGGEVLDAQQAAMPEPGADAGEELLQNLARELALAREAVTPARAAADLRGAPALEAPSGSATSHVATQLSGLATAASTAAAAEQATVRSPVGSPRWAEELGSRLVMMSTRGQHEGSLSLAPEHLGPLEVRISMSQSTAHVWFGAQHADTRAALAEALPRLREMLADAGLSLGQSGVSQEAPRQEREPRIALHEGGEGTQPVAPAAPGPRRALSGLLDLYA